MCVNMLGYSRFVPRHSTDLLDKGSLRQEFCRESLAWRSIKHRFVLPLMGLFEHKSQLYLVTPFAANGTLCDWRKTQAPAVADVRRLVRL